MDKFEKVMLSLRKKLLMIFMNVHRNLYSMIYSISAGYIKLKVERIFRFPTLFIIHMCIYAYIILLEYNLEYRSILKGA